MQRMSARDLRTSVVGFMKEHQNYEVNWPCLMKIYKTTDLSQVTDKLYHLMLCRVHLGNVSGDRHNCIGSYKSNYLTITTTDV
jgi:hypothetical protein